MVGACVALLLVAVPAGAEQGVARIGRDVELVEPRLDPGAAAELRERFVERVLAEHEPGTWAPLRMDLTDADLALMGLPPHAVLRELEFDQPTMVRRDGSAEPVELPPVASFAGAGWFGIRPGAWLLFVDARGVGWCSAAHVYGTPGNYDIATAGHCGANGDEVSVIAAFGNDEGVLNPILLDIGEMTQVRDGGLGNDSALIDLDPGVQHLVTPTMAFWAGPQGIFSAEGAVAGVNVPRRGAPSVTVQPNPFLAQDIVHYGHGTAVGAGGTPRTAAAIAWGATHFMFSGAITPGDSGSGANTLGGDSVGAVREAAGIITHLYVDPLMRQGIGIMGGTRSTAVSGTLANGQLVPYPVPVPGAP